MDGRRFGILMTQVAACLGLSLAGLGTAQLAHAQTDSCAASVSGSFTHASGGSLLANLLGPMAGGESSSAGTLNQGACSPGEPASVSLQGPGTLAGNPVDLLSGAKLQRTVDGSWGTSSGVSLDDAAVLVVSRFHVKGQASSTALGPGWRLGLDTRLHAVPGPGEPDLQIVQGDGRVVRFGRGRRDMSGAVRHEALIREDGVLEQSKTAKLPWLWQWRSGRRLSFDEQGRLRRIDSPASAALGLTYDTRGRLSEVASANGRAIGLRYPVASQAAFPDRLSEVWLPGGGRVRYRYDLAGRLSRVARADGSEISYRYVDGNSGRLAGIVWPDGKASEYRYDSFGRVVYSRAAGASASQALVLSYQGQPGAGSGHTTIHINRQLRARYHWQAVGPMRSPALVQASGAGCASCPPTGVIWRYDRSGRLVDMRSAPGALANSFAQLMRLERDRSGRVVGVRWRRGESDRHVRVVWKSLGLTDTVESIEWPSVIPGRRVRLLTRQDSRGRLVALEQQGFAPRVSLAASGQPQVEAEPIRRDLHDPVLLTGALGISPVQVRPGNHRLWRDDFGRAVAQWSPDSGLVRRRFDQADRLVEEWRADGSHAQHHYDAAGRLISTRVKPAGQDFDRVQADAQKVTLQWQGFEVASIQGPGQHDFFERDSRGRVSSHQLSLQLHDGSWRNYQTHFWRDAAGRLASWSLPGGGRLHLRRDSAGQVVGLYWQPSGLSSRLPVVHKLGRDVNGLGRMVLGNRVVAHFERDDKGHLARLVHRLPGGLRPSTVLLDHRLEHDHHGRLLGWSDGTQQRRYLVDATGRLLQAAHRSAVGSAQFWRFAYDAQGNRRFAQAPTPNAPAGLTQKFQRDGLSNRLASPGRSTPGQTSQQAWDAAGRLVRNGRWSYRWDADGRLEQASWDGSPVARYRYNHRGQRIARQVGGQVTHYLYDAQRRLLAELDERGTVQRQYLYLADWPVAVLDRIRAPETPENSVASARPVFQIRFLHLNHLGAPELVTNIRGQVLWRATYAPFGRRLAGSEPAPFSGYRLALRLPGQIEDPETGLHYNDHRYYNPDTGRYLSPDPLGPDAGPNPYVYASNSPLTKIDPSGLLLFAFDGTDNGDPPSRQDDWSNVYKLARSYSDGRVWYMNGVGRDDPASGIMTNGLDMLNANTARMRVDYLVAELERVIGAAGRSSTALNIDVIGFSRGAAMARDFSNQVADRIRDGTFAQAGACVRLRFVGLWDTVAQFGANGLSNAGWRLSIPPETGYAAHAVALNEHRALFPAESIVGSPLAGVRIERGFVGAHADVGGSYAQGDLSDIALVWMHQQAGLAGVQLFALTSEFERVSSPLLHDSSGGSGDREFRYRNDWGWVYANPQQRAASVDGMQWADTDQFIERYPQPLPDVYGEPTLAGEVDLASYSQWLGLNYGLTLAGI